MFSQFVAEFSKFRLARVLETELESHASYVMVEVLYMGVGTEKLQALAVGLPEEFNLWIVKLFS